VQCITTREHTRNRAKAHEFRLHDCIIKYGILPNYYSQNLLNYHNSLKVLEQNLLTVGLFTLTSSTKSLPQLRNEYRHPYNARPHRPGTLKTVMKKNKTLLKTSLSIPLNDALQFELEDLYRLKEAWDAFPFVYRLNDGFSTNNILQQVCSDRGWKEYEDYSNVDKRLASIYKLERPRDRHWNIWWRCVPLFSFTILPVHSIHAWQYLNHCPKIFQFSNKNTLCL